MSANLHEALEKHSITLTPEQTALTEKYCHMLWAWNEQLNLTRHLDYDTFVARDVVDSMHLAECLEHKERVLDFGSGGGVPGILVAILRPDIRMTLCESIEKKTKTLVDMIQKLDLKTRVINARVQDLLRKRKGQGPRFEVLMARAVGPMSKILRWVNPYWTSFDRLLLIKGPRWVEERKEARHLGLVSELDLRCVKSYPMPGTESESVIVCFTKKPKSTSAAK